MSESTELSWPTVTEAAAQLKTSARTVLRKIAAGEIEARKRPRLGAKAETVCNPADLQKLLPAAHVMPADGASSAIAARKPPAGRNALGLAGQAHLQNFLDRLAASLATIASSQRPRIEEGTGKRWLTLQEASEHSGLSARLLRRAIQAGELRAIRDGKRWKIERDALDRFDPETISESAALLQ